jgi:hypothetical protein
VVTRLAAWPHAGRLLTQPIQTGLIASSWDELLRLAGSLKFGHATASLLLRRLQASARQNTLAKALVEYGRLIRTVFLLRYLADEELRRRIHRQLKGENLHALRRRPPGRMHLSGAALRQNINLAAAHSVPSGNGRHWGGSGVADQPAPRWLRAQPGSPSRLSAGSIP